MTPLLQKYNRSKARDYFIGELTKGSRLLVLYKNNAFKMYGDWYKDGDLWVSNTTYKEDYQWYGSGYYGWHNYMDDDYYGYYDDYYERLALKDKSKEIKTNDNRVNTEEANALWQEVVDKEYKFVSDKQLKLLKDSSDDYTNNTIELCGYVLGYDKQQSLVWLEETPVSLEGE